MTPQEVDALFSSVYDSACRLCAVLLETPGPASRLCPECAFHIQEQNRELKDEPCAERFAMILGLTKGCKKIKSVEYTDKVVKGEMTDRMMHTFALISTSHDYPQSRQDLIWSRFCALFISQTADLLAASLGRGPLASFDCFMLVLSELRIEPSFTRFLLSDDPRAMSGNHLAIFVAEQLILHSSRWEREAEMRDPQPPMTFLVMQHTCLVLGLILCVQVDKAAAERMPEEVRSRVQAILRRWAQKWSGKETLMIGLRVAYPSLLEDDKYYSYAREHRELWECLRTCAREGCAKTENLYICARCQGALYCSRQHQREHWTAKPLPHRQICYRPCF